MTLPALILPLAASMETILTEVEKGVLTGKLAAVTGVATSLAAACVAISLIGIGAKYLKGTQFDSWQFVRPLLIFFVVANFSTIVLGPVRAIAGVYNTRLAATVGNSTDQFKAIFKERSEELCRQEFGYKEDGSAENSATTDPDGKPTFGERLRHIGTKLVKAFYKINEKINLGTASLVSGVLYFFLNMSVSVLVISSRLYLVIMALIGPYTFAIAILTAYPNGIRLWVERYIQFTLWQPLLYIVMYLGTEVLIQGNRIPSWGGFWTWCFCTVAIFIIIGQVPHIASIIIEGTGLDQLAGRMSGVGSSLLQKASSTSMLLR